MRFPFRKKGLELTVGAVGTSGFTVVAPPFIFTGQNLADRTLSIEELSDFHPAVLAAHRLLSNGVQAMPFRCILPAIPGHAEQDVGDNRLIKALNAPGLKAALTIDLASRGECFAYLGDAPGSTILRIPPALVTVEGKGLIVTGYRVSTDGEEIPPEQMLHVRLPRNRTDTLLRGGSPLEALRADLAEDFAAIQGAKYTWMGTGYVLERPLEAPKLSERARNRIEEAFTPRMVNTPARAVVLEEGMTARPVPADRMQSYTDGRRLVVELVASVYGIPPAMLAAAVSNQNADAGQRSADNDAVAPFADLIAAGLTEKAVPIFYADNPLVDRIQVVCDQSDRQRDRFVQRAAAYQMALGTAEAPGWLTPAEVRMMEGLSPEGAQAAQPALAGKGETA